MPRPKMRGNGQGSAYRRKRSWEACIVIGWVIPSDPTKKPYPKKHRKTGFPTKAAALEYCMTYTKMDHERQRRKLEQVYEEWSAKYASRVGESTMSGYKAAYKHFSRLHSAWIDGITAQDLQDCMDSCSSGKRTHQMMKVVAGLLWGYACDSDYVDKNITENLYTGKGESKQREPLTDKEVEAIRKAIPKEPYASYIYALCYLGFRPGEFLKLKKSDLHTEEGLVYLTGGSKTEAGKNRMVPVPSTIMPIIENRMSVSGTDLLFPQTIFSRKGEFTGYKPMSDEYFRKHVFKPLMSRLGIAEGKVPYSARHTYSDKLKNAAGDDKTKAAIIGHTDYQFTQKRYQSTTTKDIKKVADTID